MRKYLRSKARGRMIRAGYVHINDTDYKNGKIKSFFAENWRKFI